MAIEIVSVGPSPTRTAERVDPRLDAMVATVKAFVGEIEVKAIQCEGLDDLPPLADGDRRLLRLFGRSCTHAMTWLGAKGRVPTPVAVIGYADGVIQSSGQPMRAIGVFPKAMVTAFALSKWTFDTSGAGLLVGACDKTRIVAAGLALLGLKKISIVDPDDTKSDALVQLLRRRLFGVDIVVLSRALLTQVPAEDSIAVNLVESSEAALLEDVSYLNFLRDGGVWIDWTRATSVLGLADEITNAGARVLPPEPIQMWSDALLVEEFLVDLAALAPMVPRPKAEDIYRSLHPPA